MFRACELKDQTYKKTRTLQFSDIYKVGSIPDSICGMRNLDLLHLGTNRFQGSLPDQMGLLQGMQNFQVEHNSLAASIPDAIGLGALNVRAACLQNETAPKSFNFKTNNGPKNDPKLPRKNLSLVLLCRISHRH